jgi:nucleoside-triphosphatase THEP1
MNNIIITGERHIGKSTLIRKTIDFLRKDFFRITIKGFFTFLEISESQRTLYFKFIDSQEKIILAKSAGKMIPSIEGFNYATSLLKRYSLTGNFLIIDELGYLETDFPLFQKEVLRLVYEAECSFLVLRKSSTPFLDGIKGLDNSEIIEVTLQERDVLFDKIKELVSLQLSSPKAIPHKE